MSKKEFLHQLFNEHLNDFRRFVFKKSSFIICPICLKRLFKTDIEKKIVSDGHVWPEFLRSQDSTGELSKFRVILCKDCNNKSGERGDKQMQLVEQLRKGMQQNEFWGKRKINLFPHDGSQSIKIQAKANFAEGMKDGIFSFESGNYDPHKLTQLLSKAQSNTHFSAEILPHHELIKGVAEIGWITAGYLLLFWTFGYMYILSAQLDPVRELILKSFNFDKKDQIKIGHEIIRFGVHNYDNYKQPVIRLIIPTDGVLPIYIQIRIENYEIDLPFHGIKERFEELSRDLRVTGNLPEQKGDFWAIVAEITLKKFTILESSFCDFLLGR